MRHKRQLLSVLCILIGMGVLLYPWLSDYLYTREMKQEYLGYERSIASLDVKEGDQLWNRALEYNQRLGSGHLAGVEQKTEFEYEKQLVSGDNDIMGYLEIPSIQVNLPIGHGTEEQVLRRGVGHMKGTALPVGGLSTHCVLTGHTGINQARLLTDLVDVKVGDLFYLHVLGRVLTYRVSRIRTVDPSDVSRLSVQEGSDLCTLVTCTPYGVNTMRLLVTGEREETEAVVIEAGRSEAEDAHSSSWTRHYRNALMAALLLVGVCLLTRALFRRIRRHP